jgi:ABC-2 type transport system ATP-binding protein
LENTKIIEARNLCKTYGGQNALENVSFTVKKGEICGFVGRNGAGKTTFLRIIMGLAAKSSGEFGLFGAFDETGIIAARKKIGCIIESPAIYPNKTAKDNLKIAGLVKNIPDISAEFERFGLGEYGKKKAGNFSLGMKQRLAIAMAMIGKPELLILDEPLNGLDPPSIFEMNEIIKSLAAEGVTVFISSHILSELSRIADSCIFIDKGKIIAQKTIAEISETGENLEEYFLNLIGKRGLSQ